MICQLVRVVLKKSDKWKFASTQPPPPPPLNSVYDSINVTLRISILKNVMHLCNGILSPPNLLSTGSPPPPLPLPASFPCIYVLSTCVKIVTIVQYTQEFNIHISTTSNDYVIFNSVLYDLSDQCWIRIRLHSLFRRNKLWMTVSYFLFLHDFWDQYIFPISYFCIRLEIRWYRLKSKHENGLYSLSHPPLGFPQPNV